MELFFIDLSKYEIVKSVRQCDDKHNTDTFIVQQKETKKEYFAKVYKTRLETQECKQNLVRGILKYLNVNQQDALEITGISAVDFNGNPYPTVLTPYMPNGSLRDLINREQEKKQSNEWTTTMKRICLIGIIEGLTYLYNQQIMNGNIKFENILLDQNYYTKLSDYGYSKIIEKSCTCSTEPIMEEKDEETLMRENVRSFGQILIELAKNNNSNDNISDELSTSNTIINGIITKCINPKQDERPTIEDIIKELTDNKPFWLENIDEEKFRDYLSFNMGSDAKEKKDYSAAAEYYKQAIKLGNSEAMFFYAVMLRAGEGVEKNPQKSIKYLKRAIDLGNSASMRWYGKFVEKNHDEKAKLFKQAIEHGNIRAMNDYAILIREGKVNGKNIQDAIECFKQGIEFGDSDSMICYADMLLNGEGTEKNPQEAERYYKQAIEQGDCDAMTRFADLLLTGEGIEKDPQEALKYIKQAIELGDNHAMNYYSRMLRFGTEVNENIELSEQFLILKRKIQKGD